MGRGCFATRLSHFLTLSAAEESALSALEEGERRYRRGDAIRQQGEPAHELFIVRNGWLYSHIAIDVGKRQILRLEFPGDLMGTSSVAFGKASSSVTAVTDCTVCPLERTALTKLFEKHSRIGMLLFLISQAERVALDDRLASLGRTSAKSRIAALLLEILVRRRIMSDDDLTSFELPLTQEDIGDATGLTSVHVNRMMQELSRDGMIARDRSTVRISDEKGLIALAGFINRYSQIDTSWLSPSR